MGNVIRIAKPRQTVSGENVVERLEEALAMAKDGLVENFLVLAVLKDGGVMDCWANGSKPFAIVGGLESVKRDFMTQIIESRE